MSDCLSPPKFLNQISNFGPTKSSPSHSNDFYIIRNFILQGSPKEALLFFTRSRRRGTSHWVGVSPLIFKACALLSFLSYGQCLHAYSIRAGMDCNIMVGTSLVGMYAKCGSINCARKMFDYMPERNVVTWNSMIGGYLKNGDTRRAMLLFEQMSVRTVVTWNVMIDGFARMGDTIIAKKLFDQVPMELKNVVTRTVLVDGYTSNGEMEAASEVFEKMPQRSSFVWSSMISGYCKKGDLNEAKAIFDRIPDRNLVNWNSLISGYAQNGFCHEALESFHKLHAEGFVPDEVTMTSVLSACAQLGELNFGKEIHKMISHKGIEYNQFILNALIDMYAKCGDLTNARFIFERMTEKNIACWNSMISGFAIHGQCKAALEFFGLMEDSNIRPDDITFLSVLSACAHGGFINEGMEIFAKMEKYGLAGSIKHYGCLVDLLGRAGRLKEAYELIKRMPMRPNEVVLGTLLGGCRLHLDTGMMELILKEICVLNSNMRANNDSFYVLRSSIYAASDRWEEAERMRIVMKIEGFQKTPGCSSFMPFHS